MQQELELPGKVCFDWRDATTYSKRVKGAAKFCAERHKIYIMKSNNSPAPWTDDWVMRGSRFTNVYRELDRVTVDIMHGWVNPNIDNPNVAVVALVGRLVNYPDTLLAMESKGLNFKNSANSKRAWALFQELKKTQRQLVTGAYIVNTIFPKGHPKIDGSKADYIANCFFQEAWGKRKDLASALETKSFSTMLEAFTKVRGIGRFLGNQAAVDLTYTGHLTKDIEGSWSPGPGTIKGIRRVTGDYALNPGTDEMSVALTRYQNDLNNELAKFPQFSTSTKKMRTHLVPVSTPNASNTLCEISKHFDMVTGARSRMKNRYNGG